jgi:peptidoglycan/LPS O-acetylase OafA/YrhL
MTAGRVSIPHVRALDGLRGAAVAGVLLFHGGHLTGGYLGVDLFFVLSGFLITTLLLVESDSRGSIRLGSFWARRARRLLPALAGVLVGVALYCVVFADPDELNQIRDGAFSTIGYVANWQAIFSGNDYWAMFRAPSPLEHTWSLAIEEQFYLVWPLVFVGLLAWWKRRTPQAVLVTSLVLAAASTALMLWLYEPANTARVYYGTDTRATAILLGAALAAALVVWGEVRSHAGRIALEIAGVVGVAVLAWAWTGLDGGSETLYRGGLLACGIAAVAIIAASMHPRRGPISHAFSWKPLCLLGLISYGVYLWHWPVDIVVSADATGITGWPLFFVQFACTLVIATASYLLLEMPIRRGAGNARQWAVAIPATAAVLVVLVVVVTGGATQPPSASAASRRLAAGVRSARIAGPATPRVLVVGDSVAWHFGTALERRLVPPTAVVANISKIGCIFPDGVKGIDYQDGVHFAAPERPSCNGVLGPALRRFRPTIVLFVAWAPGTAVFVYDGPEERSCDTRYRERYQRALEELATRTQQAGARLVITSYPYSTFDASSRRYRKQVDCVNQTRESTAAATGSTYLDLQRLLCQGPARCEVNGHTLRPDGVHFEGPAMVSVADRVGLALGLSPAPVIPR